MKYLWLLLIPSLLPLAACDTTFPNEEMDVAGDGKTRPFAIVCEPAEAAPGETVTVSLLYYEAHPDRHSVSWQVALDYDLGLYETDEVERDYVQPDTVTPTTWDEHGYCRQFVTLAVPDDAVLRASSQPEVIQDELVLALARPLLERRTDEPVTKTEIDAFLKDIAGTENWDQALDPDTATAVRWLSDLFACRIRFRATIDGSVLLDVTKTLTVRYSREIRTPNVNENPEPNFLRIAAVPYPEVEYEDFPQYAEEIRTWELASVDGAEGPAAVPLYADWTYYLYTAPSLQTYLSPFELEERREDFSLRWYHLDLTDPGAGHPLFVKDDGDEAEMGDLNEEVRLKHPASSGHVYRVFVCTRDERLEWSAYAFAPGASAVVAEFGFVDP